MDDANPVDQDELFYNYPYWPPLVEAADSGTLSEHPVPEQYRFLLGVLLGEIGNGGTAQWFDNQWEHITATVDMLKAIGAHETAALLEAINELLPGGIPKLDHAGREEQMAHVIEEKGEEFEERCQALDDYLMGKELSDGEWLSGEEDPAALFVEYLNKGNAD